LRLLKLDLYSLNLDKYTLGEDLYSLKLDAYTLGMDKYTLGKDLYSLKLDAYTLRGWYREAGVALATLRKGTCGKLAFAISTELTTFLADLDAADVEKRSELQHQLYTARFTATTGDNENGFTGTVQWLHGKLLAHSCIGALATLRKGTCGSLAFRCSTELTDFLADLLDAAADEKRTDAQHQLHTMRFTVPTNGDNPEVFTDTVQSLGGKLLVALSTQHHVLMEIGAWAQDAAANHGLSSGLPSSVGELGAGAGTGGAAVRSPGLYKGGPMTDEHDRLAIRAIIQHHMPKSLTVTKIAQLAGLPNASSSAFQRKFRMYKDEVGRGWKCTEATAAKSSKQYVLA
jgi:hypothetical protein